MSDRTGIEYVNATCNPLGWGCFGPGGSADNPKRCPYCYAHGLAERHLRTCPECRAFIPHWHPEQLDLLAKWKKPRRIFVQSMGDLFGEWQDYAEIWNVLRAAHAAPQHTYLFLTKSPERMASEVREFRFEYSTTDIEASRHWFGVTITNQADAVNRLPHLFQTMAAGRWLSIEPIQGEILLDGSLGNYWDASGNWRNVAYRVDWVTVGAETGNRKGKIKPKPEWIEQIITHCEKASVPVWMKRNLAPYWDGPLIQQLPEGWR